MTRSTKVLLRASVLALGLAMLPGASIPAFAMDPTASSQIVEVNYRSAVIDGIEIAYREAGYPARPTVLLLHGFPTSSHMFRNLIPALAGRYHVLAPDYPGFGASSMPAAESFEYSFTNIALDDDDFARPQGR